MNKKLNKIKVPRGKGKDLAKVFNCTAPRVSQALNGTITEGLTDKIRHVALTQFGGIEYAPVIKHN